jgi:hypothetical protein
MGTGYHFAERSRKGPWFQVIQRLASGLEITVLDFIADVGQAQRHAFRLNLQ